MPKQVVLKFPVEFPEEDLNMDLDAITHYKKEVSASRRK